MRKHKIRSMLLSLPLALSITAPAVAQKPVESRTSEVSTSAPPVLTERLGFWSATEQETGYRAMETIFPTNVIAAGGRVHELPLAARELPVAFTYEHRPYTVDDFMKTQRVSGLLIVHKGKIVLERYGLGRKNTDRWTSFSIAKSVMSTLLGASIRDGHIKSLDDPITRYVPELKGGAFEGVTLRDALTMRSGVKFNEDYYDPQSDFSRYATHTGPAFYKIMSNMPREASPGIKHHYSTAESNLLGAAVMRATGKPLSQYLSEKIWKPFGMEADGVWIKSPEGFETAGICFSATLRDYGRFGLFMLSGGKADGRSVLPEGWIAEATASHVKNAFGEIGYGYQWWTGPGTAYRGIGIMGQALYIDPERQLVVVIQSAWNRAGGPTNYGPQWAFLDAAAKAADRAAASALPAETQQQKIVGKLR